VRYFESLKFCNPPTRPISPGNGSHPRFLLVTENDPHSAGQSSPDANNSQPDDLNFDIMVVENYR
jgi:hypothetical protein